MWDFEQFSIRHAHFFLWVCVLRARISNSPQVSNSPTRSTHQQQQHQHFIIIIMGMFSFSSCSWLSSREQIIWRWKIIKSLFMLLYAQKWKINNESNVIDVNAKWKTSLRRMFSLFSSSTHNVRSVAGTSTLTHSSRSPLEFFHFPTSTKMAMMMMLMLSLKPFSYWGWNEGWIKTATRENL